MSKSSRSKQSVLSELEVLESQVPELQPKAKESSPELTPAQLELRKLLHILPKEQLDQLLTPQKKQEPAFPAQFAWYLCDMAEGEFPKTYQFETTEKLAAAIVAAEGRETALVAFYGVRLPFSKLQVTNAGKHCRYLLLPDDKAVVLSDSVQVIDQSLLPESIEMEEEGWVGDMAHMDHPGYYRSVYPDDSATTT